jgi:hypothetical protein
MSDDDQAAEPAGQGEEAGRAWRPSRRPDYRLDRRAPPSGRIVERARSRGWLRNLADLLRLPAVKAVIAVSLFVLAAILFDATINGGSWTERPPKPKATQKAPRG